MSKRAKKKAGKWNDAGARPANQPEPVAPSEGGASPGGLLFASALTALFLVLGIVGIMHHEMWRDEYQAWLLAADAKSLLDLLENTRYEGHPLLWHLVLFLVTGVTDNPIGMQLTHIVLAAASVFVFARFGPLGKLWKILFAFGYFTFFEFALISREYALSVLLALIATALFVRVKKRILAFSMVLFFLANSSIYGLILAVVFALIAGWELFRARSAKGHGASPSRAILVVALCIVLLGALLSLLQIVPPADSDFPVTVDFSFDGGRLQTSLTRLLFAYLPLPDIGPDVFWNTSLLDGLPLTVRCVLSVALFVLFGIHFLERRAAAIFYLLCTSTMLLFYYLTDLEYLRYFGHLFIVLVIAKWLLDAGAGGSGDEQPRSRWLSFPARTVLAVLLVAQSFAGVYAYCRDVALPFSHITAAGEYIRQTGLDDQMIFGAVDYRISPLSAIVHKPVYFPQRDEEGLFIRWDKKRDWDVTSDEVMRKAVALATARKRGMLMALSYTIVQTRNNRTVPVIEAGITRNITLRFLEKFTDPCICEDQGLYLYQMEYKPDLR